MPEDLRPPPVERPSVSWAALKELQARFLDVLATDDAREGLTAFLQKRQPHWTGK